jgi:hypothetical protein
MTMVEQIWKMMNEQKMLPDVWILTVMMQHFAKKGNIPRMLEFFEQIPEQQRNSVVDAILIDG